ncbi:unnamed protein product, partial [Pylaiella littoralis]
GEAHARELEAASGEEQADDDSDSEADVENVTPSTAQQQQQQHSCSSLDRRRQRRLGKHGLLRSHTAPPTGAAALSRLATNQIRSGEIP